MGPTETVLIIDGPFIELAVRSMPEVLIRAACQAPSVVKMNNDDPDMMN